ncbi:carmil, putative [Entamoeba invadens IP1]|uniref:Carmil, putative n=1 Tax=Entamoeba invadens IP1 TaxID=370355 RepID=A0A0A1UGU5_ENTIV|nr:carmil, putative [Entamoeba invadens IP1]ELP95169.1 carmil, putative [Entamoeba invadens IP1]|eukprot:XP_004261940.1 carmil, putative [Entamoeba invadens IP1]
MGNDVSQIEKYYDKNSPNPNLGYPKFGDSVRWKGVLKVIEKKKGKDALVVVTKHRIYFFNPKEFKAPVYQSHLFDIVEISIPSNSKIVLTFSIKNGKKTKTAEFNEQSALEMVRAIRTALRDTTNNTQEVSLLKVTDFNNITKPNEEFTLSPSSAMVEAYLSECSHYNETPSINHMYYLQRLSVDKDFAFDFSKVPGVCDDKSPLNFSLARAFNALSYTNCFTEIKLRNVKVKELDKALAFFLRRNEYIKVLEVVDCSSKLDVSQFSEELQMSPVQILNFHGTQIVKGEMLGLVIGKRVYKLTKIDLGNCGISKVGEMLRGMMMSDTVLKHLKAMDVSNNSTNDDTSEQLVLFAEKLSTIQSSIEYLNVANMAVPLDRYMPFMKPLQLKFLNISGNRFTKLDKAMELISYFQNNESLKQICMSEMKFATDHIVPVLSPIANNEHLVEISLDLKNNNFGLDGGIELYKIFPSFKNVKKLDLSGNKLKGKAMVRILVFMEKFEKMETLYIGDNQMSGKELEEFLTDLTSFVDTHKNLKTLKIDGICEKFDDAFNGFLYAMERNNTLLALDISDNELNDSATIPLGELLMHNKTMIALNFDGNEFTGEGFLALRYAMEYNDVLSFVEYPSKMYKKVAKNLSNVELLERFQDSFYNFFNKVKTNKANNCFADVHIFNIINSYRLQMGMPELVDTEKEPKLIGKEIVKTVEFDYQMPEQFQCFEELKKDPSIYYS